MLPTPGRRRWLPLLAAAMAGYTAGAITTGRLRRQRDAARHAAAHDHLTGLPNRRAAIAHVDALLTARTSFRLVLVDLDDFKSINDVHGHLVGDDVLTTVAARLRYAAAPYGFAARLAGDEFLLALPDPHDDHTVRAVLAPLAEPVPAGAATVRPRASAGVATTSDHVSTWRDLFARADQALYRAKNTGDGIAFYHPDRDGLPHVAEAPQLSGRRRRTRDH